MYERFRWEEEVSCVDTPLRVYLVPTILCTFINMIILLLLYLASFALFVDAFNADQERIRLSVAGLFPMRRNPGQSFVLQ